MGGKIVQTKFQFGEEEQECTFARNRDCWLSINFGIGVIVCPNLGVTIAGLTDHICWLNILLLAVVTLEDTLCIAVRF